MRSIAALGMCVLATWLGCSRAGPPPAELQGVWRSTSPAYKNRSFEVRPSSVLFGTGKYTMDMWPLEGVLSEDAGPADTLYTLRYVGQDREVVELRVHHLAGPPESLRFENRQEVWLRADAPNSSNSSNSSTKKKQEAERRRAS